MAATRLVNRNITAGAGRTSMRLEPEIWDALREICLREGLELRALMKEIELVAGDGGGRTSAVRVYVLQYFRAAATEDGHRRCGHGGAARIDHTAHHDVGKPVSDEGALLADGPAAG